ncbi:ABC transporter ATP-binding protein [Calderihabitans maritimus]|uniref:Monosaccharide-transporting ATPase n=1 Tax=Calderihabitans maritimus TaxID=1246530 RepID=A0A1Z5HR95_9FIRM|nr:ABC transporter ATP-binding protein [Calderihabitans maritimus]GAW91790.1 monosaccharide-transporting ATPase [Calderihabitans maritimus]
MALYKIENLTYYYPENKKPALRKVNLTIEEGEFILLVGRSGCGKSSLARVLAGLIPDFYGGTYGGHVYFDGVKLDRNSRRQIARQVGIVFQDPEKQVVMTRVERELAFGLENLGLSQEEMKRRVAEVVSFFNLTELVRLPVSSLSGGQKQKVALAAVMAMHPRVLILDEPTSQLDPTSAEEILALIKRLHEELGLTVVMVEQRLERCFHLADRIVLLDEGQILCDASPAEFARWAIKNNSMFLPPVAKFFAWLGSSTIPLTVQEGRALLRNWAERRAFKFEPETTKLPFNSVVKTQASRVVAEVENLWFSYFPGKEVLKGIRLSLREGELVALLGGNGAGKSTLLRHLIGLLKPDRGKVLVMGRDTKKCQAEDLARYVSYLSQNPNDYLFQDTVEGELQFTLNNFDLKDRGEIERTLKVLDLWKYRHVNPRDLSSGERQRVALASVLVVQPQILLLDEPTRGLDYQLKESLGKLLLRLKDTGTTVLLVTHDVEFAAEFAERVVIMFDGQVVADGHKSQVLDGAIFYSPQLNKLFRDHRRGIITYRDALAQLGGVAYGLD